MTPIGPNSEFLEAIAQRRNCGYTTALIELAMQRNDFRSKMKGRKIVRIAVSSEREKKVIPHSVTRPRPEELIGARRDPPTLIPDNHLLLLAIDEYRQRINYLEGQVLSLGGTL